MRIYLGLLVCLTCVLLSVSGANAASATLSWTATGDDGLSGAATVYDIRYSSSAITDANWASATRAVGVPAPKVSGSAETFTVTGLTESAAYYFAIKAGDEVPNWSALSNVIQKTASQETIAPSAIANLAAGSVTSTSVALSWTAPGDDATSGTATTYDIRYSTSAITAANWASASQVTGETAPKIAGSAEAFLVSGLSPSTTYYFAIKTADEVPNWSTLSNVISKATSAESTPPAAIANLLVGAVTSTSVALSWTAPGDDGNVGTASQYDIRYSTAVITSANFTAATKTVSAPTPQTSGGAESFMVTGLSSGTTYYFAVKAADEVPNWAAISNVVSGATVIIAPAPPTLASPASGATGIATGPTLTWNSSATATSYRVQVSIDAAFGTMFVNQSNVSATSLAVAGLSGSTQYYWRVAASNAGGMSANSTVWSFTTGTSTLPGVPILAAPASGATGVALSLTFSWNASTGATSYRFQLSTNSTFGTTVRDQSGLTGTTLAVTGLSPNTSYYWRVSASNSGGTSAYSSIRSFATLSAESTPPSAIANLVAYNELSTSVALSWTAPGDDGNVGTASQYDVRYSTAAITAANFSSATKVASAPTPKIAGSAEAFRISGLNTATTYYFAVKTADEVPNWAAISNVVSRATLIAAPTPPTLASPASGATGVSTSPTLSWNSSTTATSYRVQVSTTSAFSTMAVNQSNVAATSLAVTGLSASTLYYWRVSASNAGGMSGSSTVRSFTTGTSTAPGVPTLAAPANGATGVALSPTLSWNASSGATSYRLQVSTSSAFGTIFLDRSGLTGTTLAVTGLSGNATYYWHVSASNAGGTSAYSSTRSFATLTGPPMAPTLLSPLNAATNAFLNPSLTWNASSGATSYRVQLSTSSTFGTTVVNQGGLTGTTLNVSGLSTYTNYYWHVSATNAGGTSSYSATWMFKTGRTIGAVAADDGSEDNSTDESALPFEFSLSQNYPNPFNPSTTISFALPEASEVAIEVFNIMGQKVATLVQGRLEAGNHQIQWNGQVEGGGPAATGVYFCRMQAGDFVESRKMLLMK
jgi:phosphodiesterase/alkaline phosphatase D-like protein